LYRDDPDPGIHGAAGWLLRRWGYGDEVRQIDQELATGKIEGDRRWLVNKQGQTLVVIPGPVEFLMGSPAGERDRYLTRFSIVVGSSGVMRLAARK
jgi:eukaryotic-like serine/threonine-protein kinase